MEQKAAVGHSKQQRSDDWAHIAFVPTRGINLIDTPVFPIGTEPFFLFVHDEGAALGLTVKLRTDGSPYEEYAFHNDLLTLADLVVEYDLLPVIVKLVTSFLRLELRSRHSRTTVTHAVTVRTADGAVTTVRYSGPADSYRLHLDESALDVTIGQRR